MVHAFWKVQALNSLGASFCSMGEIQALLCLERGIWKLLALPMSTT